MKDWQFNYRQFIGHRNKIWDSGAEKLSVIWDLGCGSQHWDLGFGMRVATFGSGIWDLGYGSQHLDLGCGSQKNVLGFEIWDAGTAKKSLKQNNKIILKNSKSKLIIKKGKKHS